MINYNYGQNGHFGLLVIWSFEHFVILVKLVILAMLVFLVTLVILAILVFWDLWSLKLIFCFFRTLDRLLLCLHLILESALSKGKMDRFFAECRASENRGL